MSHDATGDDGDPEREEGDEAAERYHPDPDALAGIVDLFGALTRAELRAAVAELAFKRGLVPPPGIPDPRAETDVTPADPDVTAAGGSAPVIDAAIEAYRLIEHDGRLVVGPTAFPQLPEGAVDLPHILDVAERSVDRDAVAETVERRFRAETAQAVADADAAAIATLIDVSYDLEAWGPVDVADVRRRLDDARES